MLYKEGAKIVKLWQKIFLQLIRHTALCMYHGMHRGPTNGPSNILPSPKFLWHTYRLFTAHQCAMSQWLKITEKFGFGLHIQV